MSETKISDRIRQRMEAMNLKPLELAEKSGISKTSVSFILHDKNTNLRFDTVQQLSRALRCDPIWLMTGEEDARPVQTYEDDGEPPEGMVAIKQYNVHCAAGCDAPEPTYEEEHDTRAVWYHMSFFQRLGINPNKCCRLKVSGDSMSPLINDGDYILVDRTEGQPIIDGEIYAFVQSPGGIRVKRVFKPMRGGIIIHSDNERYPDEAYDDDTQVNFKLIGRVLERSGAIV